MVAWWSRKALEARARTAYRTVGLRASRTLGITASYKQREMKARAAEVARIEKAYVKKGWIGPAGPLKPEDIGKVAGALPKDYVAAPTPRVERVFWGSPEFRAQQRKVEAMAREYAKYTEGGVYTSPSVKQFSTEWSAFTITGKLSLIHI